MSEAIATHENNSTREPKLFSRLLKNLGNKGLEGSVSLATEPTPLPAGYHYKNSKLLSPKAVGRLLRQVEMGKDLPERYLAGRNAQAKFEGYKAEDVAVGDSKGELVGFGSILYRGNEGILSDFVVSPQHQGGGIGKAITLERLRVAEQMGITKLTIPKPLSTNTLHHPNNEGQVSFYAELGFQQDEAGDLTRDTVTAPQTNLVASDSVLAQTVQKF